MCYKEPMSAQESQELAELRGICQKMRDRHPQLQWAHGGTFHLGPQLIDGTLVKKLEVMGYLTPIKHPYIDYVFELSEAGKDFANAS